MNDFLSFLGKAQELNFGGSTGRIPNFLTNSA
jgi:hypothetical protein